MCVQVYRVYLRKCECSFRHISAAPGYRHAHRDLFLYFSGVIVCDRCVPGGCAASEGLRESAVVHILFPAADRGADREIPRHRTGDRGAAADQRGRGPGHTPFYHRAVEEGAGLKYHGPGGGLRIRPAGCGAQHSQRVDRGPFLCPADLL